MRCCKLAGEFVFLCYLGHGMVADEKDANWGCCIFSNIACF